MSKIEQFASRKWPIDQSRIYLCVFFRPQSKLLGNNWPKKSFDFFIQIRYLLGRVKRLLNCNFTMLSTRSRVHYYDMWRHSTYLPTLNVERKEGWRPSVISAQLTLLVAREKRQKINRKFTFDSVCGWKARFSQQAIAWPRWICVCFWKIAWPVKCRGWKHAVK